MQLLMFFVIFLGVLALAGLVLWLMRRFGGNRLGQGGNRGRMPRLAVIDAAAVDNRRRLVLVRRDNIEHLLMIGGPSDIVIEPNIVRAQPQRDPMAPRGPVGAELPPRVAPLPDVPNWVDTADVPEPSEPVMPELPPRPARPSFVEEVRRAAPAPERRPADPLANLAPEPIARPEPRPEPRIEPQRAEPPQRVEPQPPRLRPMPRSERNEPNIPRGGDAMIPRSEAITPRTEPAAPRNIEPIVPRSEQMIPREPVMPRMAPSVEPAAKAPPIRPERPAPPPAPSPAALSAADQNLAEMAQRLEAALRSKPASEPSADRAPPVAPEPPARPAPRPASEAPLAPPARADAAPPVAPPGPKDAFENLEDEMASLLGRPKPTT